jgi:gliding motility-associated-like protein
LFQSKKIINSLIGLLVFFSSPFLLNASHIIGGKVTYRYLSLNKYELKLTVYRDCSDIYDFDNPAFLAVYDNTTNNLISNHSLTLFHRDTIHQISPDPCFVPPIGICVEEGFYLDTVLLPTNISGYTVAYQRCCHNSSILNIVNPGLTGTTITCNIPPQINNSAQFLNFPPIYVCVNDTFNYSFASNDIDGDSLVYQMCNPLIGASGSNVAPNPATPPMYLPVNWISGFSATNPLTTNGSLNFNLTNGAINFIPTMQGQYAVGICVLEYRNGNLLNTNRLEIQFNVVPCYLVSSIPTATNLCEGLTINLQNSSTNATSYNWNFGDPTTLSDTSHITNPNYTFPSYGTYSVSLIVSNSNFGLCKDTTIKVINVNPLLSPTLQPTYNVCYKNNLTNFNVGGSFDPSATFNWNLGNHTTANGSITNPTIAHFDTTTNQNIYVLISQFGCIDTLNSVINMSNPIPQIIYSSLNCNGLNLHFTNFSANSNHYFWDFGIPTLLSDTSSQTNPLFNYPTYGTYTITLIAYDGLCSDTIQYPINVQDTLSLNSINVIERQCLNNNLYSFFVNGNYNNNATFYWIFDTHANILDSYQENPTNIHFNSIGNHTVRFTITQNGCAEYREQIIKILPSPTAKFTPSDTTGCQPLKINFTNQSISTIPFTSTWQIENNTFTTLNTTHTFYNSGLYSIYLTVKDTNNCTDTVKKINYINVFPKPTALANVNPMRTDILNPTINFNDNTLNTHTTLFNFGDNISSNQIINSHTYSDTGKYNYQLIVITNFGCTDTINGIVFIEPYNALFIPNSFTPNNDNLNDTFNPIIPYYKKVAMQIFDRWGGLIYTTNDIQNGWNGTYKNLVSPNDVYIYKINVEYFDGTTKNINGTVTLIR